jgi:hypothetical protein
MTVAMFVPALKAEPLVRGSTIAKQVAANMTVAAPVLVVIPVAMYQ